jgi:NADH dehydrogenase
MKRVLVLGAGFGGLWSAIGAQRKLRELGLEREAAVQIVNRESFHNIRVRNYEADLAEVCVPLADVLDPIGVKTTIGDVVAIDPAARRVTVNTDGQPAELPYDAMVFALGSELVRPPISGLTTFGFDVDTYRGAQALESHLLGLPATEAEGRATVVIVGAGLTGLEVATEMPGRLAKLFPNGPSPRVIVADRRPYVGSDLGAAARPVIEAALQQLGIEQRTGVTVTRIERDRLILSSGEIIKSRTVIWCGGMRANPLASQLGLPLDELGRVSVDEFMRCVGATNIFAAGDVARAKVDPTHYSVMSCQHGRPMGRYAGHNVIAALFGEAMLPLTIGWYTTVVDLGPAGALYTRGFDRQVFATGAVAKDTKTIINRRRIYPPRNRNADDILAAATPVIQSPPAVQGADSFVADGLNC